MKKIDFIIFVGLIIGFILINIYQIDLSDKNFFLSSIIANEIWQFIIFGIAIFLMGKKLIDLEYQN
ncbi:hypothetical protein [Candidatus Vampirococcus lugosii]|uniref:Uncharacterized protein n=1 Tax=Candidatus Vampirococcus lugosii TaxID=2789015 RepID=A0ABS5QMM4_9BACT|nr:hypothetical protein [Candidatus Vampirococcus lugosii]MBS8122456.1 hypothetical protein [Candidatus Vampirococcus lugosii]